MSTRPTLVLVHGAWHRPTCWGDVPELLAARGWNVRVVALPTANAADKSRLGVAADTAAVTAILDEIDGAAILVAHSYGGIVAAQLDDPRVVHIVNVAAFALDVGESLMGIVGGAPAPWWHVDDGEITAGDEEITPTALFYADVAPDLAARAVADLRTQSLRSFTDELTHAAWRTVPSTFLITEQDAAFPVALQEGIAARTGGAQVRMNTSHSPFLSAPQEFVATLEGALAAAGWA